MQGRVLRRVVARAHGALRRLYRDESGVVMLETVLVFPLQLLITMVIIQIAHMYTAANVLQYAAYQGTRTYAINFTRGQDEATKLGNQVAWIIASTVNNTGGGTSTARMTGYRYKYPDYDTVGKTQMLMTFGVEGTPITKAETVAAGHIYYWLDLTVPVGGPFVYHCLGSDKTKTRPSNVGPIGQALMQQGARIPKTWPQ